MNRPEMLRALDWMLNEAECYVGCMPTEDPLEAARRIVTYFDEVRVADPERFRALMMQATWARDAAVLTKDVRSMNIYEVHAEATVDERNYRGRKSQVVAALQEAMLDKDLEPGRYRIAVTPEQP